MQVQLGKDSAQGAWRKYLCRRRVHDARLGGSRRCECIPRSAI